ncbi:MAG: DUF1292 domain-containing protein [Bacillota bacterium]|nr:DUF1292 domain-containing protein [Bacillota bacterium]
MSNDKNENDIVVLVDEDDNEVQCEWLDSIEYEGSNYAVVLPVDSEDGTVMIMEMVPDEDSDEEEAWLFNGIEDEAVLEAVFELFKGNNSDEFDFE